MCEQWRQRVESRPLSGARCRGLTRSEAAAQLGVSRWEPGLPGRTDLAVWPSRWPPRPGGCLRPIARCPWWARPSPRTCAQKARQQGDGDWPLCFSHACTRRRQSPHASGSDDALGGVTASVVRCCSLFCAGGARAGHTQLVGSACRLSRQAARLPSWNLRFLPTKSFTQTASQPCSARQSSGTARPSTLARPILGSPPTAAAALASQTRACVPPLSQHPQREQHC